MMHVNVVVASMFLSLALDSGKKCINHKLMREIDVGMFCVGPIFTVTLCFLHCFVLDIVVHLSKLAFTAR